MGGGRKADKIKGKIPKERQAPETNEKYTLWCWDVVLTKTKTKQNKTKRYDHFGTIEQV